MYKVEPNAMKILRVKWMINPDTQSVFPSKFTHSNQETGKNQSTPEDLCDEPCEFIVNLFIYFLLTLITNWFLFCPLDFAFSTLFEKFWLKTQNFNCVLELKTKEMFLFLCPSSSSKPFILRINSNAAKFCCSTYTSTQTHSLHYTTQFFSCVWSNTARCRWHHCPCLFIPLVFLVGSEATLYSCRVLHSLCSDRGSEGLRLKWGGNRRHVSDAQGWQKVVMLRSPLLDATLKTRRSTASPPWTPRGSCLQLPPLLWKVRPFIFLTTSLTRPTITFPALVECCLSSSLYNLQTCLFRPY